MATTQAIRQHGSAARTPHYRAAARAMVSPDIRGAMIAEAAYFRALRRGFEPGHELEDWLSAETEIDTALTIGVLPIGR